jgi:hypothetical protein
MPLPLPPQLAKTEKTPVTGQSDHRAVEATVVSQADGKVSELQAYRRARGLCQFCAEKWARCHKCAPTV